MKAVCIGGIESSYTNIQHLHDLGVDIIMFYARHPGAKEGWGKVDLIDENKYPFVKKLESQNRITRVKGHIKEYIKQMRELNADIGFSLGWPQMFSSNLLSTTKQGFVGIHESLLPKGRGHLPIANAIINKFERTGVTLFWLDKEADSGPIIAQIQNACSPLTATSTQIYKEDLKLEKSLLDFAVPFLKKGIAPRIPQSEKHASYFGVINWERLDPDLVERARCYPYK